MKKHLLAGILCAMLWATIGTAYAAKDYRALMLAAEAVPMDHGSFSQRMADFPVACSPDDFVRMLKGEQGDTALADVWAGLSFARSNAGNMMDIVSLGGGHISFPCTDEYIWRNRFSGIYSLASRVKRNSYASAFQIM